MKQNHNQSNLLDLAAYNISLYKLLPEMGFNSEEEWDSYESNIRYNVVPEYILNVMVNQRSNDVESESESESESDDLFYPQSIGSKRTRDAMLHGQKGSGRLVESLKDWISDIIAVSAIAGTSVGIASAFQSMFYVPQFLSEVLWGAKTIDYLHGSYYMYTVQLMIATYILNSLKADRTYKYYRRNARNMLDYMIGQSEDIIKENKNKRQKRKKVNIANKIVKDAKASFLGGARTMYATEYDAKVITKQQYGLILDILTVAESNSITIITAIDQIKNVIK